MFFTEAYAGSLPLAATDVAARWDTLYLFLVWISVFFFVGVIGAMIYFIWKYSHRSGLKPKYITGNHLLEAFFVVGPTLLLLMIFGWGYSVYHQMTAAPTDAYEIRVIGKQWLWQFQYDNGRTTTAELYVPLNRPVKLIMTSQDVIHSFFVPNFRIKQDVVPGMYTSIWFEAKIPGRHQIFCAEYCGTSHSGMLAQVIVLDDAQWKAWNAGKKLPPIPDARELAENDSSVAERKTAEVAADSVSGSQAAPAAPQLTLAQQGKNLFEVKGCTSCHSITGSPGGEQKTGPSLVGVYGQEVEFTNGHRLVRDENYLQESITKPNAKIVRGYQALMPTYQGQLTALEMNSIIAYIKSLK
jgi:cytochrome c oxidase subunit 2